MRPTENDEVKGFKNGFVFENISDGDLLFFRSFL